MEFSEYELKQLLKAIHQRIVLLEKQNPIQNAKRIKTLKRTQEDLYRRLKELKEGN